MNLNYKLYCLDGAGRIIRPVWIHAANDDEAVHQARAVKHRYNCELWLYDRKVAVIEPSAG